MPYRLDNSESVEHGLRHVRFRNQIYGRLEPGVVVFDMLRSQHVTGITGRLISLLAESVHERHGIPLVVDRDAVLAWAEERMKDPEKLSYGGRQIRNEMEHVRAAYVRYYVTAQPSPGAQVQLRVLAARFPGRQLSLAPREGERHVRVADQAYAVTLLVQTQLGQQRR